jgi:hypothetical protein
MGSWHCEQVSEPTNSAPGMFGGAITVRLTVAQEIATAVAVKTPETTSDLRRLTYLFLEQPPCAGESCNESVIGVFGFLEGLRSICERHFRKPLQAGSNTVVDPNSAKFHGPVTTVCSEPRQGSSAKYPTPN